MKLAFVYGLMAVSLIGCDYPNTKSIQSSSSLENKQTNPVTQTTDKNSSIAHASLKGSSEDDSTDKISSTNKDNKQTSSQGQTTEDGLASEFPDFIGNELNLHALDVFFNSNMLNSPYWAELYEDEFPATGVKPLMRLTSKGPLTVKEIDIVYDTGKQSHKKVLSNGFDWYFLGDKGQEYKVRLNLANNNRLTLYPVYTDNNITLAYIELEGQDMPNHPEDYSWYSCLYMYNKQLNKMMEFSPEGCVIQTIKRTWITKNAGYLRDEVSSAGVSKKNDVYTIKIKKTPRLQNSSFDMSQSKLLTFTFKFKPQDPDYQIDLIDCDYRFRESNKPITEYTECDYSFE